MKRASIPFHLLLLPLLASACEKIPAYGRANEIVVVAAVDRIPVLRDSILEILAPVVPPLKREGTFRLAFEDPAEPDWGVRLFARKMVLIGAPEEPIIAQALKGIDRRPGDTLPRILTAEDVWARNQSVSIILLDPRRESLPQVLPPLRKLAADLSDKFREGVEARMFISGRNELRRDSLLRTAGFGMVFPNVYEETRHDSLWIFRNDNPSPQDLIRQFTVAWQSPMPEDEFGVGDLLDWREKIAEEFFPYPQSVVRKSVVPDSTLGEGLDGNEIQGIWSNPPGSPWPAGGPFRLRTIGCPAQDRLYLIDAWLYAPEIDKWEYLLQMEAILDSFQCGAGSGHASRTRNQE